MLSKARRFIETAAGKKFKDLYFNFLPSQSTLFSPDRCCLSIIEGRFLFLHARKTGEKAELVYSHVFHYKEQKEFKDQLTQIVEQRGLKGVRCTWVLRPEQYHLMQTEVLPVAPGEFQAAIRWKMKDQLGFPIEDAIIDSFPMPSAKLPTSLNMIMLVVAHLSFLKPLVDQINASGLKLTTIDIQELSFRNLTALYEKDEKSSAMIFLRDENSFMIVTNHQKLYYSRYLDLSIKAVRAAQEREDSKKALASLIDTAALDIQRSFDFYQSQWRLPEPARIFLETRTPVEIDLRGLLSQRLNITVNQVDVSQYFINNAQVDLKQEGYYLPLLGAVLREWEQSYAAGN